MPEQTIKDIKKELYLMLHKAEQMLELAEDAFTKNKVAPLDEADELAREIRKKEDALTATLAKMAASNADARAIISAPAYIEKISTALARLIDGIRTRIKDGLLFSDKALQETRTLFAKSKEVLKKSGEATVTGGSSAVGSISSDSDSIISMADNFATAHEDRLVTGECSPTTSTTYLCMLYAFEDIASHTKDAVRKLVR